MANKKLEKATAKLIKTDMKYGKERDKFWKLHGHITEEEDTIIYMRVVGKPLKKYIEAGGDMNMWGRRH